MPRIPVAQSLGGHDRAVDDAAAKKSCRVLRQGDDDGAGSTDGKTADLLTRDRFLEVLSSTNWLPQEGQDNKALTVCCDLDDRDTESLPHVSPHAWQQPAGCRTSFAFDWPRLLEAPTTITSTSSFCTGRMLEGAAWESQSEPRRCPVDAARGAAWSSILGAVPISREQ